jgi:hypothetical protein
VSSISATQRSWQPWPERIWGDLPVSPSWLGVAVSLFTLIVLIAVASVSDDLRAFSERGQGLLQERDARIAVFLCVCVGFLPASQQYMMRFTQANLRALEPLLGRNAESLQLSRPNFWVYILPGILAMPAIAYAIDRDFSIYFQRVYFAQATHLFQWSVGLFATINTALGIHLSLECASVLEKRAEAIPHIDLLDLTPLAPFARQSLQTLLVWLVMLSIFSVNAADRGFFVPLLMISIVCLATSATSALRCNRTIHRRIQQAKRDELARVNDALRGDSAAKRSLSLGASGEHGALSLSDLLTYRRFIEGVREWAFDTSAWMRTALYLALPLGSWLGGAIVERALDASLK